MNRTEWNAEKRALFKRRGDLRDEPRPELLATARRLKLIREATGITQVNLARALGISTQLLVRIETGRTPIKFEVARRWRNCAAKVLGPEWHDAYMFEG